MALPRIVPPLEYLRQASPASLQSFELSRLNHAANLRREISALIDQWIQESSEAMLARWMLDQRNSLHEPHISAPDLFQPIPDCAPSTASVLSAEIVPAPPASSVRATPSAIPWKISPQNADPPPDPSLRFPPPPPSTSPEESPPALPRSFPRAPFLDDPSKPLFAPSSSPPTKFRPNPFDEAPIPPVDDSLEYGRDQTPRLFLIQPISLQLSITLR